MVYFLAEWGMGDPEIGKRGYAEPTSDPLRRTEHLDQDEDEVDLLPLTNQVRNVYIRRICLEIKLKYLRFWTGPMFQEILLESATPQYVHSTMYIGNGND